MKTYSQKPADVTRVWHLIDASQATVGRVATVAARLLIGKDKPTFTPHTDGGDYVVIINADNVQVTGGKEDKKLYHYHSGYPGGLRTQKMKDVTMVGVIEEAVRGMLPVNKLRDGRLARLKVYSGQEHKQNPQSPQPYSLKKGNK